MNLTSDFQLVNSFSRYSKITERSTTGKYRLVFEHLSDLQENNKRLSKALKIKVAGNVNAH